MPEHSTQSKGFKAIITENMVADVLNAPNESSSVKQYAIPIILMQANYEPPCRLPTIIATLIDESMSAHYFVEGQFANLVFARLVPDFKDTKQPLEVTAFWKQLMIKIPNGARAVYGNAECLIGVLGGQKRSQFGAFLVKPEYFCERLFQLPFGKMEHVI